ncbi:MAG: 7TM diverse intracellular signaling domain-containing protein [Bacteroidota bacterium]
MNRMLRFFCPLFLFLTGCTPGVELPNPELKQITSELVYYWDLSGEKTYQEVRAKFEAGQFHPLDSLNEHTNPVVLWAVYDVPVDSLREKGICIISEPNLYQHDHSFNVVEAYYRGSDGKLQHVVAGNMAHANRKAPGWEFSRSCFPVEVSHTVEQESVRLFLRLIEFQSYHPDIFVHFSSQQTDYIRWANIVASRPIPTYFQIGFFAILIYFLLYSLIQYLQLRDRAFLYYFLYLLFLLLFDLKFLDWEFNGIYGPFRNLTQWHYHLELPLGILTYGCYLLFIASFLNLKEYQPNALRWLKYTLYSMAILVVLDIVTRQIGGTYLSMLLYKYDRYPLFLFGILFFSRIFRFSKSEWHNPQYREQKVLTLIIGLGSATLLFGGIFLALIIKFHLDSLRLGDWNPNNPFMYTRTYIRIGFLLENLIFVLGLAYRVRMKETRLLQQVSGLYARLNQVRVDAHTMKNILAHIQAMGASQREAATKYLKQATELCERWYLQNVQEEASQHALFQEILDMEKWVHLNNLLISPAQAKLQLSIQGIEELSHTTPIVARRSLLPFVENALIHGFQLRHHSTHSFAHPRKLDIQVMADDEQYQVILQDNGVGIKNPEQYLIKDENRASTGIFLASERMKQAGMEVAYEPVASGTKVIITIPA